MQGHWASKPAVFAKVADGVGTASLPVELSDVRCRRLRLDRVRLRRDRARSRPARVEVHRA